MDSWLLIVSGFFLGASCCGLLFSVHDYLTRDKTVVVKQIERLYIKLGDFLVVRVGATLSREQFELVRESFAARIPGVRIIVLDKNIDIKAVIRPIPEDGGAVRTVAAASKTSHQHD